MEFMKKLIIIFAIFAAISCSDNSEMQRFGKTYKEILIVRESISDTSVANKRVQKIISDNGYSELEFREVFFDLAKDKQKFAKFIDSLRNDARKEVEKILKDKIKRNPEAYKE